MATGYQPVRDVKGPTFCFKNWAKNVPIQVSHPIFGPWGFWGGFTYKNFRFRFRFVLHHGTLVFRMRDLGAWRRKWKLLIDPQWYRSSVFHFHRESLSWDAQNSENRWGKCTSKIFSSREHRIAWYKSSLEIHRAPPWESLFVTLVGRTEICIPM